MITRKEIDSIYSECKNHVRFNIMVPWEDTSVEALNNYIEDYVEDGHLLCDISYKLVGCDVLKQEVILTVVVADMDEYFHPDNYMDDDMEG